MMPQPPMQRLPQQSDERLKSRRFRFPPSLVELVIEEEIGDAPPQGLIGLAAQPRQTVAAQVDVGPCREVFGLRQPALLQLLPNRNSRIRHEYVRRKGDVVEARGNL